MTPQAHSPGRERSQRYSRRARRDAATGRHAPAGDWLRRSPKLVWSIWAASGAQARQRLRKGHFLVLFVARDKKYIRHIPAGNWLRQPLTRAVWSTNIPAPAGAMALIGAAAVDVSAMPEVSLSLIVLFVWRQKEPKSAFGVTSAARTADGAALSRAATVPLTPFPARGLFLGRQSRFARMTQGPVICAGAGKRFRLIPKPKSPWDPPQAGRRRVAAPEPGNSLARASMK